MEWREDMIAGGLRNYLSEISLKEKNLGKGRKVKVDCTSNDTAVVVMVLMETDGKGNSHVCQAVIIHTIYIMLLERTYYT